jgi:hypothetical protein
MSYTNLISYALDTVLDDVLKRKDSAVVDLGNQRLKNKRARGDIYKRLGISASPESTKDFYLSLGFKKYLAIDVNTDKDAMAMDLNVDISQHYNFTEKFDVVTNNGTGEHVFNQFAFFSNMHNLCKVGGYMIHALPFYRWVDHGFYNFQPNLFPCLALQNNYKLHQLWIGTSDVENLEKLGGKLSRDKGYRHHFNLDSWPHDPMIVAVMQKLEDNKFSSPMQHLYNGDNISTSEISSRYK